MKKIQVFTLALANGAAAAKRTFNVTMDQEYPKCVGVYAIINSGNAYLRVGIRDNASNDVIPPVNLQHLVVSSAVKIEDRFYREVPFEANGKNVTVSVENFAALPADQNIDLLFLLSK